MTVGLHGSISSRTNTSEDRFLGRLEYRRRGNHLRALYLSRARDPGESCEGVQHSMIGS